MTDNTSIPIPRNRVFVLSDGTFVVQWEQNSVQILLTGRYRQYNGSDFGNPITNWELGQLKQAGIVTAFDDDFVHLNQQSETNQATKKRAYYLNTTLPKEKNTEVQKILQTHNLHHRFSVRIYENYTIIRAEQGRTFHNFDSAESARETLLANAPEIFADTVVAFVEMTT